MPDSTLARHAIVLGLLTAIGPFAIDMYLPALPAIGANLHAGPREVQASLMTFFLALGAGQLVAGPVSDMLGRRRPMIAGLVLFAAASVGCALATDIATLIGLRLLQGLGACAAMVTPRAVVRDLYGSGPQSARLMTLLLTVYSVSPIAAPPLGDLVAELAGWRAVFCVIALAALGGIVLVWRGLPETRSREARLQSHPRVALAAYAALLRDRHFIAMAGAASLAVSAFFVYVANSAFVLTRHYGVSTRAYAWLFALNAVAFVVLSQVAGRLHARFGMRRALRWALATDVGVMAMLIAALAAGIDRLDLLVVALMLVFGLNAVVVPAAFVLAMERHAERAGTASALIGTLNFAGGALVVALVAPWTNGMPLPMLAGIAACASLACALARRATP